MMADWNQHYLAMRRCRRLGRWVAGAL
jgi:hypothetical protein